MIKRKKKEGYYFPGFYYMVGKDEDSIFFQLLCEVAILHFWILVQKKWLPHFLLWKYKEKDNVWGKAPHETK